MKKKYVAPDISYADTVENPPIICTSIKSDDEKGNGTEPWTEQDLKGNTIDGKSDFE